MRASVLVALMVAGAAAAQPRHLETLELSLAGVAPVGETYDGLWVAEPGAALHIGTEFYGGQAYVAFDVFGNTPSEAGLPEFLALHGNVGWGLTLSLPARLRLVGGGTVGAVHLRFDDEDDDRFPDALQNETELTAGLFVRLGARIGGPVHAFVGGDLARVYTATPIVYRRVRAGLSLRIPMPTAVRRLVE